MLCKAVHFLILTFLKRAGFQYHAVGFRLHTVSYALLSTNQKFSDKVLRKFW